MTAEVEVRQIKLTKISKRNEPYEALPAEDIPPHIFTEEFLQKAAEALKQFEKDDEFLQANYDRWKEEYPDQWVAVFQKQLVGVGDTLKEVLQQAENEGATRHRLTIKLLVTKYVPMVLAKAAI